MIRTIIAVFLIFAFGWWWTGPSSDEFVAYPAYCANDIAILPRVMSLRMETTEIYKHDYKKYREDRANCLIIPGNRTTYKINTARAEIYYVMGDFDTPRRLVDCAIISQKNWICSYPDGSGKVAVIDGLEAIHVDEPKRLAPHFFYQRRWQWWAAKLYVRFEPPSGAWMIPEQHAYY